MSLNALLILALVVLPAVQAPVPSALQSDPTGWTDLLADKGLTDWVRVPMSAVGKLPAGKADDPSPWSLATAGGTLVCEGGKAGHEMLRYGKPFGDFVLHVEWRFTKLEGEPAYNSGVFVRTPADASTWIQAQMGPAGGFLFGSFLLDGAVQRFNLRQQMTDNRNKPAGEWNIYEIRAAGRTLTLWFNGAVTSEYTECGAASGFIGLEAEGYRVEFRNVKVKRLP